MGFNLESSFSVVLVLGLVQENRESLGLDLDFEDMEAFSYGLCFADKQRECFKLEKMSEKLGILPLGDFRFENSLKSFIC